jgi:hypothetical protein
MKGLRPAACLCARCLELVDDPDAENSSHEEFRSQGVAPVFGGELTRSTFADFQASDDDAELRGYWEKLPAGG